MFTESFLSLKQKLYLFYECSCIIISTYNPLKTTLYGSSIQIFLFCIHLIDHYNLWLYFNLIFIFIYIFVYLYLYQISLFTYLYIIVGVLKFATANEKKH